MHVLYFHVDAFCTRTPVELTSENPVPAVLCYNQCMRMGIPQYSLLYICRLAVWDM